MASDKIYVPQHNIEAGAIQELCELIVEGSVEYIRKGALLEWAKEELSKVSVSSKRIGRRNAFIDVIDKLNSM